MTKTAFSSDHPDVLSAWFEYVRRTNEVHEFRVALEERVGRRLMLKGRGLGHGTTCVGFAVEPNERPGDVLDEGSLRILKTGHSNVAVPNTRRAAGKALDRQLSTLDQDGPSLPGMPEFAMVGFGRVLAPAVLMHDGRIWVNWGEEFGEVPDPSLWRREQQSAFHLAAEAHEAVQQEFEAEGE